MSADALAASFGRVAPDYELARPGWPDEAIAAVDGTVDAVVWTRHAT